MKSIMQGLLLIAVVSVFGQATAHDPSQHAAKSEKPDCAAFAKMDHSKMDPQNPVMQAMMKKCKDALEHGHAETDPDHADHGEHHHPDHGQHNHSSNNSASGHAH